MIVAALLVSFVSVVTALVAWRQSEHVERELVRMEQDMLRMERRLRSMLLEEVGQ